MTYDELQKIGFVEHHRCGGCGSPVGFEIHPELSAACFQSGCDCGGTYPNYRALTHAELAEIEIPTPDDLHTSDEDDFDVIED